MNLSVEISISLILGFVAGVLLIRLLKGSVIEHGPDSNQIRREIHQYGGKCYKFVPQPYICPI